MRLKKRPGLAMLRIIVSSLIVPLLTIFVLLSQHFVTELSWPESELQSSQGSCLSRSNGHRYSRSKLPPASEKLVVSWVKYQERHKLCSGERNWTEVLDGRGDDQCKYLFYLEGSEGLGNRILSLASAATYALLTDRVLMIDSRKTLSRILCQPFQGSSWLLPDDFPYWIVDTGLSLGAAADKSFTGVNVIRLWLNHDQSDTDSRFFCDESQQSLNRVKNLAWVSNQYHLTSLFQVPVLWDKLLQLFPEDNLEVFGRISELFILPANNVWKLITQFYADEQISSSRTVIGVQVRPFYRPNITAFDPFVSKLIRDCLEDNLLVPKIVSSNSRNLRSLKTVRSDISILVASLQGKYFEFFRELYEQHATEDGKTVKLHRLSSEGREQHSLEQDVLALAEMWLLSLSDHIVTSEFSTFGYVANGISGLRPFFLGIQESKSCFRSSTSQPCTHFPQAPECRFNWTSEHRAWLQLHVKPCQDHRMGVQLVN